VGQGAIAPPLSTVYDPKMVCGLEISCCGPTTTNLRPRTMHVNQLQLGHKTVYFLLPIIV
jgi:hypothetical protein